MKTPRRTVEFKLERWRIQEKGFTTPPFLVRCELIWPRPLIENRKTVMPLPDRIGEQVDWRDAPLKKKFLFKEEIEGTFVFTAAILPLDDTEDVDLGETGDLLGRSYARETSITWRTLSDLLDLGESMASYLLSGPQKVIATGDADIGQQEDQTLEIPLTTPNKLRNPQPDPAPENHRSADEHQDVLKQPGEDNGFLEISMEVWEE